MAQILFKVWDLSRQHKVSIVLTDNDNEMLYNNLVLKASEKLELDGFHLVLECDGTTVDEDAVLRLLQKEVLLLLTKSQTWEPQYPSVSTPSSLASTVTLRSTSSPSRSPLREISYSELLQNTGCIENDNRISASTWKLLPLPLHQLSKTCVEECRIGNKLNKQAIVEVVHAVVDTIREVKPDAPLDAFKCLAHKLVDKFPDMFEDRDEDGFIIGSGTHSIYSKLQERNNYLNRPHKRKSLKTTLNITPKQQKLMLTAKAGCSKWQPDTHDEPSEDTLLAKTEFLKTAARETDLKVSDDPELLSALNSTYAQQRLFLNNPVSPTIDDIRTSWPILLTSEGMCWHYKELMQHSIHDLTRALQSKTQKILEFGVLKKLIPRLPEENIYLEAVKILALFFRENINVFFCPKTAAQIIPTNSPCILQNSMDENGTMCTVFIEKQEIQSFSNFEVALEFTFAAYYVFNMAYPKDLGCTLEFIQRYFLKINPDQGSKNKTKKGSLKIISLINNLRKMDLIKV